MTESDVIKGQIADMVVEGGLDEAPPTDTIQQMLDIMPHGFKGTIMEQLYWFLGEEEAAKVSRKYSDGGDECEIGLDAILDRIMIVHPELGSKKAAFEHAIDVIHLRYHPNRHNITIDSPVPAGKKEKKKK